MEIFSGIMAYIGLSICLFVIVILMSGWVTTVEQAGKDRSMAIFNNDERRKVIATRKLFLWAPMPVIFPFVLLYLLGRSIVRGFMNAGNVIKDLQLGKSVDKL